MITSLQNTRIKDAVKLRSRRARTTQQRIIIDGLRELQLALTAQVEFQELFYCRPLCCNEASQALLADMQQTAAELLEVTESVFSKLAFGQRSEGIVAVATTPQNDLNQLTLGSNPLVAVLEGIEKPGNVGAVLRSADAAGVAAVIVTDEGTDLYNPNAIRSSLGAIFTVAVCSASSEEALVWLRRHDFSIFAARVDGAVDYAEVDYRGNAAIVLGNEAQGLSPLWQGEAIAAIKLPMRGQVDSLNVSATAAVLFYQAQLQRQQS